MQAPNPILACREAILAWSRLRELAEFAEQRRGYMNSDGGFGIEYPEGLDEYQKAVEKIEIPAGSVMVSGYCIAVPPGYDILVPERVYLTVLAEILTENSLLKEARRVESLVTN